MTLKKLMTFSFMKIELFYGQLTSCQVPSQNHLPVMRSPRPYGPLDDDGWTNYDCTIDNLVCQIESAGSLKHGVHSWSTFLNSLETV